MLLPRMVEEVVITVPSTVYDEAVAVLAREGFFHVDEPPSSLGGGYAARKYRGFYARVNEKLGKLDSYYKALRFEPQPVKGLEVKAGGWEEAFERIQAEYRDVERSYDAGVQRLTVIEAKLKEYEALKAVLEPLKEVEADVREALRAALIGYAIGYVYGEGVADAVLAEASKHDVIAAVQPAGEAAAVVAVAGQPEAIRKFLSAIRQYRWTPISIPEELPGSPKEAYEEVIERMEALQGESQAIIEELKPMKGGLDAYRTLVHALREVARLLENTVFTETMAVFRGFVDKSVSKRLRGLLDEELGGRYIALSLGVRRAAERVPSKVDLPGVLKPFHSIVRMYGEPEADEIVPTVFVAVTFPLIFALMFPDMGHGLLVLLFTLLYFRGRESDWKFILSVLGAASMVTGFLAGEFFGTLVASRVGLISFWESLGFHAPPLAQATYAVEEHLGEETLRTLLYNTISIALWLGGFMLSLGTLLGVIDALLKGDKIRALTGKLPFFIFFFSATLPFLATADAARGGSILHQAVFERGSGGVIQAITFYGSLAGLVLKLVGEPVGYALEGGSVLHGLGEAFMGVYEMILMALGNIPSFLRIMGLGLAHSGLMLGFTQLYYATAGSTLLPGAAALVAGGAVYAVGNLMVAGLEAIIAFAHSMRLHFYEYFSKFYSGAGKAFNPVRVPGVTFIISG